MTTTLTPPDSPANQGERERGATLVEYVLMISLIALACVVSMKYLGDATRDGISESNSSMFAP
jgi:Flp pilus assembly pilin Flp